MKKVLLRHTFTRIQYKAILRTASSHTSLLTSVHYLVVLNSLFKGDQHRII